MGGASRYDSKSLFRPEKKCQGERLRGVGTLASPSFGAMDCTTSFGETDWATQGSPPCSTPLPPLRLFSSGEGKRPVSPGKGKTFPGLSTLSGSKTSFTSHIAASSSSLNINDMYCLFSIPTPYSPLRLPPLLTAISTTSRPAL